MNISDLRAAHSCLTANALDGLLLDGVALAAVARRHGTPAWAIGAPSLRRRYRRLAAAMPGVAIHYAVKANDDLAVIRTLAAEGAGADVVSGGEMLRALRAGVSPARIIFSGVGKTRAELMLALDHAVGQLNVESHEELMMLSRLAAARGQVARVALRVNPDVDAGTLDGISTGRAGDKFGIPLGDAAALYALASGLPGIRTIGLAVHIGSQIMGTAAFAAAYARMAGLVATLRSDGHEVARMDCGGGLGIAYGNEATCLPEAWAACLLAAFGGLGLELAIEPGRWLVGPAGVLLASVVRTRRAGLARPIVILDAAMNDLARPAMYGAWHGLLPVSPTLLHAPTEQADVAGPVCESSDFLARNRDLPRLPDDSTVAILDCGAYGSTMSSTYNARPWAAHIIIDPAYPDGFALTRPRGTIAGLWAGEEMP